MRPISKNVFLKIDTSLNDTYKNDKGEVIMGHNGSPLIFAEANTFEKYHERNQVATVAFAPKSYNVPKDFLPIKMKEGDTVLVSHLASEKEHAVDFNGENYFVQDISEIYAVLDGDKCLPLLDNVFLEPVYDKEDELAKGGIILKTAPSKKPREGIVKYLSDYGKNIGLKEGMRVMFPRSFRYEIKFFGNTYYKLNADDIFALVN